MGFTRFVEIGRIAYVVAGPNEGKIIVIVDVIDQNRALVDGPCSGVKRQSMRFKEMHLTKLVMKLSPSARTSTVIKQWTKQDVNKQWAATTWAKKIVLRDCKIGMGDFDRHMLMKARQAKNILIKVELAKLRKTMKLKPRRVHKKQHFSALAQSQIDSASA